jgi:hypothetical protein
MNSISQVSYFLSCQSLMWEWRQPIKKFKCNFFSIAPIDHSSIPHRLFHSLTAWWKTTMEFYIIANAAMRSYGQILTSLLPASMALIIAHPNVSTPPLIRASYFKKRNCMQDSWFEEQCWHSANLNVEGVENRISSVYLWNEWEWRIAWNQWVWLNMCSCVHVVQICLDIHWIVRSPIDIKCRIRYTSVREKIMTKLSNNSQRCQCMYITRLVVAMCETMLITIILG